MVRLQPHIHVADNDFDEDEQAVKPALTELGHRNNLRVLLVSLASAIGAFLFGLDIGYIAPILECASFKRDVAHLEDWKDESSAISSIDSGFLVGIFSLGCIMSSFPVISGYFLDSWGRRSSIGIGAAIFMVAVILQATSSSMPQMFVGRFVAGLSVGLLSTVVTLYQGEIAPASLRGSLTSLYQLMIAFGILVAAFADMLLVRHDDGWRLAVWLQGIPSALMLIFLCFMPRSPRWLVSQGRKEEALQVLQYIRASDTIARDELSEIVDSHEVALAMGAPTWDNFFSGRVGKLVALGATLQILQQLVGMNAIMYFGPRIFHSLGLRMNVFQTITNAVNFLATFPAIYLADKCGRRALLISGSIGMSISCLVMGIVGLMFMAHPHDDIGLESSSKTTGLIVAFMVFFFVINFAYSWGPMVWVYCAEIFPLKYRGRGVGLTTAANWCGNYAIAQFTPWLLEELGFGTFLVFFAFTLLGLVLSRWLPETKGVPLEQMDRLFDAKFGMASSHVDNDEGEELTLSRKESNDGIPQEIGRIHNVIDSETVLENDAI